MDTLLEQFFSNRHEFQDLDLTLSRIDSALEWIAPKINAKFVHIAGTNGKGSTSQFIAGLLAKEGYRVLLFTSPHIESITERIQDNLPYVTAIRTRSSDVGAGFARPISIELFDELFLKSKPAIERFNLSFFEAVFLMTMVLAGEVDGRVQSPSPYAYAPPSPQVGGESIDTLATMGYDYVILETGLGGRFDATNTNYIKEKLPVITTIAQDHQYILGFKVEEILKEKLGIVKDSPVLFVGENQEFIYKLIEQFINPPPPMGEGSRERGTVKYLIDSKLSPSLSVPQTSPPSGESITAFYPTPFNYNYALAHNVAEYLLGRKLEIARLPLPPCRQERFGRVMLDGAHNPSGLIALLKGYQPDVAVVSHTSDRDLKKFTNILSKKVKKIILTTIPDNERAYSVEKLKKLPYEFVENPIDAVNRALDLTEGEVLVTGSFYLCAVIRRRMNA